LVAAGLARVFGAPATRPGGPDAEAQWQQLNRLEAKAKAQRLGGWGGKVANSGSTNSTLPSANDAFFEKARARANATQAPAPAPSTSSTAPGGGADVIDLNTATLQQLERLPKIGGVLAARIVEARPFATVEDLQRVKGIKGATFAAVSPWVCVKAK
jgi:DNA uptake protein ComE-like DNA-binding protein